MRNTQSLPVAAYHPSEEKHFLQDKLSKTRVLEIEHLLRAAIVIGGKENGLEYCRQVMDKKETQEKQAIDAIELASRDGVSIDEKRKIGEVNKLVTDVERQKQNLKKDIDEKYDELLEDIKEKREKAVNLSKRNVERINAGQTTIKPVDIVDLPITEITDKTFSIVIGKQSTELQQIKHQINEYNGEILSVDVNDDTVQNSGGRIRTSADVIVTDPSNTEIPHGGKTDATVITMNELDNVFQYKKHQESENTMTVRKQDTTSVDIENLGYELPLKSLALITESTLDTPIGKETNPSDEHIYPFIPWCGVTICTCKRKHGLNTDVTHLCSHEIYVLHKISAESAPLNNNSIPERFKRFVYPEIYNKCRNMLV